jgi:hypothetical protein
MKQREDTVSSVQYAITLLEFADGGEETPCMEGGCKYD